MMHDFTLTFGVAGNAGPFMAEGWSPAEPGFTWTQGNRAILELPKPPPAEYRLKLDLHAYLPADRPWQRIGVTLDDTLIGYRHQVVPHKAYDFWLPYNVIDAATDPMPLRFDLPDATRPCDHGEGKDDRVLAASFFSLELAQLPVKGPDTDMPRIAWDIESFGSNCEIGLMQRRAGAEPISLLRYAASRLRSLLPALDAGFAGLGEAANIDLSVRDAGQRHAQWIVHDRRYGFEFQTGTHPDAMPADAIVARERRRLPYLAQKLMADLAAGEKLFIYSGDAMTDAAAAAPLAEAMRRYGRATLLAVLADPGRTGQVRRAGDNLLIGYVSRLTPMHAAVTLRWEDWFRMLPVAHEMWKTGR